MIKKKLVSVFFILLLLAITPAFQTEPVFAENKLRQIIKIADTYPANVAFYDVPIDPPLLSKDRAFLFWNVMHISENDASDTFKSVEILDENTLRLIGENTATGNNVIDFIVFIVEYDADSEIDVQHIRNSLVNATTQEFSIGAVNTTSSFLIDRGHVINASVSAIGDNDLNRLRILNSTSYELVLGNFPTVISENQFVSIVDLNMSDASVQRGTLTMSGTGATRTGGVDFTSIDPSRTLLLVSSAYSNTLPDSEAEPDELMLEATLTSGGDITFSRQDDIGSLDIAWSLVEFPADFVKISHFTSTVSGFTLDVVVPEILDFDKVFAMSHVSTPFGYSGGEVNDDADEGAIDRGQAIFGIRDSTTVRIQRDDTTNTMTIGWQIVEFLEPNVTENAQGNNTLRQIVKIEDEYVGASSDNQFFTISPPLLDVSKAIVFMSTSNAFSDTADDVSERIKRYEIFNTTTFRITGSNDPNLSNEVMPFSATIVEFNGTSPVKVQRDQIQYTADSSNDARFLEGEFLMHMSPVNASGTNVMFQGWSGNAGGSAGNDFTYGAEEVIKVRIINGTQWGYELDNPTDFQEAVGIVNFIDWGQNNISVQRGEESFSATSINVSPITDVIQNQTLLFATIRSTNNEFDNEPDDLAVFAHLDNSSPPNIIFEKTSSTETIEVSWELISFPLRSLFVQHGIHNMTAGQSNTTSTIPRPVQNVSDAFVIGTVNIQNGYSGGKGSLTTTDNFGEVTAKMTLDDSTTARFERGQSVGSFDVGFQVVEFQGAFSVVALETVGGDIETNATGDPVPACCNDGVISDPNATYTEFEIDVIHQLLEWFNPTSSAIDAMINDIENNGKALFEIILRMNNGTYGVDANLTKSAEFYQTQYLDRGNLTEFINNIIPDVRTNFGATTP